MCCIKMEELFWDLRIVSFVRGLLYCVLIWESPLSEVPCTLSVPRCCLCLFELDVCWVRADGIGMFSSSDRKLSRQSFWKK